MTDWAAAYFEQGYPRRWSLSGPSESTAQEVADLWEHLGLRKGALILDVGCGHGKYACEFGRRGARAVGIDFSAALLRRAQRLAAELPVKVAWIRGDMRILPVASARCDAAIILDSFGFFDRDEENDSVLAEIVRVLAPGGRVAMKVVNADSLLAGFRPNDREERDGVVVELARTIAENATQLIEDITIHDRSSSRTFQRRQRLYRPPELFRSFADAGLGVVHLQLSRAIVIVAEKVAR
jgi:ubiquinone/menaquinone biosynthesis C-methylase UbiE